MAFQAAAGGLEIDSVPKYERLRADLIRQLKQGTLKPGEALPTENDLAQMSGMSRNTVRQALDQLCRQGLIRRTRGRGTFIHESAMDRLQTGVELFGLVLPESRGGYYPSLQRGFHEATAERQQQMIVAETDNDPFRQADVLLRLMDQKVAGIAIVPSTSSTAAAHQVRPIQERGIPVVFCHRTIEGTQAPLVTFAVGEVGRLAGSEMARRGHRVIAMLGGLRAGLGTQYELSLRNAIEAAGGELPEAFVRYGNAPRITAEHEHFIEASLHALLTAPQRPTAIFCTFDSDAEVAYLALTRMGIRMPEDLSLVGFGGTWRGTVIARRLTSVAVDEEELGRVAAELLTQMRRGGRPLDDVAEVVLPLALTDGETLGHAPAKAGALAIRA